MSAWNAGEKGEEEERLSVKTSNYFSPFPSSSLGRQQKLKLMLNFLLLSFFFKMFQIFLSNNNFAGVVASESTQNPHWHVRHKEERGEYLLKSSRENCCVYASECGMCLRLRGTAQASLSLHVIQDADLRQRREKRKYEKLQRVGNPSISREVSVSLTHKEKRPT